MNLNVNRKTTIDNNFNARRSGHDDGKLQRDPAHREGVAYRDIRPEPSAAVPNRRSARPRTRRASAQAVPRGRPIAQRPATAQGAANRAGGAADRSQASSDRAGGARRTAHRGERNDRHATWRDRRRFASRHQQRRSRRSSARQQQRASGAAHPQPRAAAAAAAAERAAAAVVAAAAGMSGDDATCRDRESSMLGRSLVCLGAYRSGWPSVAATCHRVPTAKAAEAFASRPRPRRTRLV